jgi:flagellar basal-body rod modification protein FlgD
MDGVNKHLPSFESLGLTKPKEKVDHKSSSGQADEKPKLGQEDFMRLMMTQMNNQDPLKPMEKSEFISQMAQFSSLSGLKDIKDSFGTLASALQSSQALQASSMVGRDVLIPGNKASLTADGKLHGAVQVPSQTDNLKVEIRDKTGQLVKTLDLGEKGPGTATFDWDGVIKAADEQVPGAKEVKAEPGVYSVVAQMMVDGKPQAIDTLVTDKVSSVSLGKGQKGVMLNLEQTGSTSLADVKEIM